MKLYKKTFIIGMSLLTSLSCVEEQDLIIPNPNGISSADFSLRGSEALLSFSTAAYGDLQLRGTFARHAFFIHDGMSDECDAGQMEADKQQMHDYAVDPANIGVTRYWIACNQGIAKANAVLNNIEAINQSGASEDEINQAIGENHFLRAYYYFLLTSRFGSVPMPLVPTDGAVASVGIGKTDRALVYQQIISDLDAAIPLCGTRASLGSDNAGRATKGAAHALKARVYLNNPSGPVDYVSAVASLREVLADPSGYTIDGVDYAANFNVAGEHNNESIFEINFSDEFDVNAQGGAWSTTGSGFAESTFRGIEYATFGNLPTSATLRNAFETDDPRFPVTVRPNNRWMKYTLPDDNNPPAGPINVRVIRTADVLLMLAECLNAIDSVANRTEILSLMNQVRDRVGMPNYGTPAMDTDFPVTNQAEILAAIQHERMVELAGEQVRLNDLLRWGIAKEAIEANRLNTIQNTPPINFIIGKHELLPIPSREIDQNVGLTNADQNPGF